MRVLFTAATLLALFGATPAYAAGDAAAGQAASVVCAACHGPDGNSTNPEWPKIAGQHASYIEAQLEAFKRGERQNAVMAGMVAVLDEKAMADLAAFYAAQPGSGGFVSEDRKAAGEKVYRTGNADAGAPACIACHGPRGAGNGPGGFPALSGQHAAYTAAQLRAYRSGTRENEMMQAVARWLTDDDIDAVSEYAAGLH